MVSAAFTSSIIVSIILLLLPYDAGTLFPNFISLQMSGLLTFTCFLVRLMFKTSGCFED